MEIIKAENIIKSYLRPDKSKTQVLKGINLSVEKSEFLSIMGPSGAGKSTLLYILSTFESADSGKLYFDNYGEINITDINSNSISAFRNEKLGFIFQFHHLLPEFNALENVMMPAFIKGQNSKALEEKAMTLLERVGVDKQAKQKPAELSGGEQQRVAIARALINDPEIVFADEPTGNLDTKNTQSIIELINEVKTEYGLTFVVATHSDFVSENADRIVRINDGLLV